MKADDVTQLITEPDFWRGAPKGDLSSMALARPSDGDASKLKPLYDVHQKTFDLSENTDREEFQKLRSSVYSKTGGILEIYCERHFDKVTRKVQVDYEWAIATLVPMLEPLDENNIGAVTGAPSAGVLLLS